MSYRDPYYNYRVPYDDDEYYYQTFPSRRRSTQYQPMRPKMRRSLSSSNLSTDYHGHFYNEDPYYHYHYQQEMYDKNQYYEHVPDDDYEELDGEPMTELEKIAAHNAKLNQARSRLTYPDNHISSSSLPQAPHPSPSSLHDNIAAENEYIPSEPSSTPTSSSITLVDHSNNNNNNSNNNSNSNNSNENNNNNNNNNFTSNNNSSTATNKENEQSSDPSAPFQKKKLWPFSSLFKKAQAVYSSPISSPRLPKAPTSSTSTPYKNTYYVSPPSSTASTSPVIANKNTENSFVWAFRVPIHDAHSTIWRKFDDINQQKLQHHVQSNNFNELDMFDSHIGSGKVPIVATPFQGCCYYPTDLSMQNLDRLDIKRLPSNVFNS